MQWIDDYDFNAANFWRCSQWKSILQLSWMRMYVWLLYYLMAEWVLFLHWQVWQYVTLMKRIYLVDCPGVVYPTAETPTEFVLKGVVCIIIIDSLGVILSKDMCMCFLCCLRSKVAYRDHFVQLLSVPVSVCLSGSNTFLVVTHSYVSQATHAFLPMLQLCSFISVMLGDQ